MDLISDWHGEVVTKSLLDELVACKYGSVFTNGSDQAHVQEVTNVLVSLDLVFKVWNDGVLWLILVKELAPFLFKTSNTLWQFLVEEGVIVSELMFGESDDVEPHLLIHPVVFLVTVIDTGTSFKEDTNISRCKDTSLDEDLEAHHQLESNLVSFEKTSVNVSVNLASQSLNDILYTVLDKLCLSRV